ncbi:TRADD-N-associated membrane domain-containing protein [Micromonospora echinaurantiaca]|uniref:TRADD-N-associated membrane domain-containing protein n=1 Tax=Micromonospora echinaurantiaca TaxID=47857 RepID=UPI00342230BC
MAMDDVGPENRRSVAAVGENHGIVVTGGSVIYQAGRDVHLPDRTLASERQELFFQFFRQALSQAETTFRLSVIFMSCGAAIIIASAVLALVNTGNPNLDYLPLVTSLTGVLITTGGGALAIHANRARKHLTDQAEKLDIRIDEDHQLEKAQGLIDRVEDPALKDRLNAMTAMRVLKMQPDPETAAESILPKDSSPSGEIGPGGRR